MFGILIMKDATIREAARNLYLASGTSATWRISDKLRATEGRNWKVNERTIFELRSSVLLSDEQFRNSIIAGNGKHWQISNVSNSLVTIDKNVNVEKQSDIDIVNSLIDLASMSDKRQILISLVQNLETEISKRLSKASYPIETLLKAADAFIMLNYAADKYFYFLFRLVDMNWEKLTLSKYNVIQLLFYVGIYRTSPESLMTKIELYLEKVVESFTPSQISLCCHAYFVSNSCIRNQNLLIEIDRKVISSTASFQLYEIANVLKVFRHAGYDSLKFYDGLAENLVGREIILRDKFQSSSINHICFAYSAARMYNEELLDKIFDAVSISLSKNAFAFRTKDLSRILWSCMTLGKSSPVYIGDMLIEMFDRDRARWNFPESFIEGLVTLAASGRFPENFLDQAFSSDFTHYKAGRLLDQTFQLLLLDNLVSLECPNYAGNKLSELTKSSLIGKIRSCDSLQFDVIRRLGFAELIEALHQMFGETSVHCGYILSSSKLPDIVLVFDENHKIVDCPPKDFAKTDDNMIRKMLEKRRRTTGGSERRLAQRSVFQNILKEETESKHSSLKPEVFQPTAVHGAGRKQITFKVLGWNQYLKNVPDLLGLHKIDIKLLQKLGYHVVLIPPMEADKLASVNARERISAIKEYLSLADIRI